MIDYDIECYPNFFSFTSYHDWTNEIFQFEISPRVNQVGAFYQYMEWLIANRIRMVGFNNIGYDYPVIHELITQNYTSYYQIYDTSNRIINTPWNNRFDNQVAPWDILTPQIDLFLINHFDNEARRTSLKQLEFVMGAQNLEDLPYPPGEPIPETEQAFNTVLGYNVNDVIETYHFRKHCEKAIEFRDEMSAKYSKNFTNFNDTKIGKQYFVMKLNEAGVMTHKDKKPLQTFRSSIYLGAVLFDYIHFDRPEFQAIVRHLRETTITETKGALNLVADLDGFEFVFGLGGIHGSIEKESVYSDEEYIITDADVASYYPNIAIVNRVFPDHLSDKFCDVYQDVFNQRKQYAKGTTENAAMKLALNGVYGDSNSVWSPFYDPQYTMTITVNGQLMLCMLAEQLLTIPGCRMLQINTDGLTVRYPRKYKAMYDHFCSQWQKMTKLVLEFVDYQSMHIRDVNNYVAVGVDGKKKFKGAYVHTGAHENGELTWNQNHSALVIKKAAAAAITEGVPVAEFIRNHTVMRDFLLFTKVGHNETLELRYDIMWGGSVVFENVLHSRLQNASRYYVSNTGHKLFKTRPPLRRRGASVEMVMPYWISRKRTGMNKNLKVKTLHEYNNAIAAGYKTKDGGQFETGAIRESAVDKNWLVTPANKLHDGMQFDINYKYYIEEAEKLVDGVFKNDQTNR